MNWAERGPNWKRIQDAGFGFSQAQASQEQVSPPSLGIEPRMGNGVGKQACEAKGKLVVLVRPAPRPISTRQSHEILPDTICIQRHRMPFPILISSASLFGALPLTGPGSVAICSRVVCLGCTRLRERGWPYKVMQSSEPSLPGMGTVCRVNAVQCQC